MKRHNKQMEITQVEYDDRDILCFEFDNDEWVAVTQYKFATEEQRRLIEEHPRFEGWEEEPPDSDEEYETEDEDEEREQKEREAMQKEDKY